MLNTTVVKSPTYVCNGVTTQFATGFEFQANTELLPTATNTITGAVTYPSFTATGANKAGGGIVTISPALDNANLVIHRVTPKKQPYRLAAFNTDNYENALDNLGQQIQEVDAELLSLQGGGFINALDYPTLQAAYDAAPAHSIIVIPPGAYADQSVSGTKFVKWIVQETPSAGIFFDLPGHIEYPFLDRMVYARNATVNDYANTQFYRNANYSGGTPGQTNFNLLANTLVGPNVTKFEWSLVGLLENQSQNGEHVAVYGQSKKTVSNASATWASVFEARNETGAAEASLLEAIEVDVVGNGADPSDLRRGIEIIGFKHGTGTRCDIGIGLRITPAGGDPANAKFNRGIVLEGEYITCVDLKDADPDGAALRFGRGYGIGWDADFTYRTRMDASLAVLKIEESTNERVGFTVSPTPDIRLNGTKVIGVRDTGWTAATGTANKGAFVTGTATLSQCAERIKALEDALRSHGLIN